MPGRRLRLVAIGGVASLAVLSAAAAAGQQAEEPDGLARVELTLAARQISVGYEPALRASDPAHALLLSASPDVTQAEVRLGHLPGDTGLCALAPSVPTRASHHDPGQTTSSG